jgi:hypothetical protein
MRNLFLTTQFKNDKQGNPTKRFRAQTAVDAKQFKKFKSMSNSFSKALEAVRTKKESERSAAKKYNVSRDSIRRALAANCTEAAVRGRPRVLFFAFEAILAATIREFHERDLPIPAYELPQMAMRYAASVGNNKFKASKHWQREFFKRHPELTRRNGTTLDAKRYSNCNVPTGQAWIRNVQKWYIEVFGSDTDFDPSRVFNMDESPTNPDDHGTKLLGIKGKPLKRISSGRGEFFTLMLCVSASGYVTRPLLIFEGQHVMSNWLPEERLDPDPLLYASPGHSMNETIFKTWLTNFAAEVKPRSGRPVILFLDNHDSHVTDGSIKHAKSLHIELFGLPKNTTSSFQPLDVGVFGPVKIAWKQALDK